MNFYLEEKLDSNNNLHNEVAYYVGKVKKSLDELLSFISKLKLTKKKTITTDEDSEDLFL